MSAIPVQDILNYLNLARTNPSAFAQYVQKEIAMFIDNDTLPLYPGCNYSTNEGKSAWQEAYSFLLHQKPLPPYELNQGLTLAAEDHAIDMAQTGIFGHNSSNGASFSDRIAKRCGQSYGSSGENIGSEFKVGGRDHALQTILGLIIDDGVSSRGHRKNIFSTDFKYVGISSRVQEDKIVTVFDFHSNNLPTKNGSSNSNNIGTNVTYESNSSPYVADNGWVQQGGSSGFSSESGFGGNLGGNFGNFGGNSGGRYIVSQNTTTKTSTCNGVKTITKIVKTKYSDGSEEQEQEETVTH